MRYTWMLIFCLILSGCKETPSNVQREMENDAYTQVVERATTEQDSQAAQTMVKLEQQFASYHFKEVIRTARTIEQSDLAPDHPIRERAQLIEQTAQEKIKQVRQFEGTYEVERSTFENEPFEGSGRIHVSFDSRNTFVASLQFDHFGTAGSFRNDTEVIRFEPDLSARLFFSEGSVTYRFVRSSLRLTFEGPGGKKTYQLYEVT